MSSHDGLSRLPNELITGIAAKLPTNLDVKNLRLTCKRLGEVALASLELSRVFISAHPLNINVMREIADHEQLRFKVTQVIWDDARFDKCVWNFRDIDRKLNLTQQPMLFRSSLNNNRRDLRSRLNEGELSSCDFVDLLRESQAEPPAGLSWDSCWEILSQAKAETSASFSWDFYQELLSLAEAETSASFSWDYYQQLSQQQDEALQTASDEEALKYALARFPRLKRITLTPVAHGFLFMPLYRTPLIRKFPRGLNYPIPRSWPITDIAFTSPKAPLWQSEEVKGRWRGL